ncbi:hypothetical protein HY463_00040 [Candidatus Peregrinibacteria bacterium]|nr:hypothetical protein [Candidatus Peregrinibacteria bacterium]
MALRIQQDGETPEGIRARAAAVNNFNPQEVVRFPDEVIVPQDGQMGTNEDFAGLPDALKKTARPVQLRLRNGYSEKAVAVGEKYYPIADFNEYGEGARYPMFSPHKNHVYLTPLDHKLAYTHRRIREAVPRW